MVVFRYSGNWAGYLEGTSTTVSQNVSGNTSVVKVDVWIGMDAGSSIQFGNTYNNTVRISCDGQSQTLPVGPLYLNGSKKHLGSVQFTVTHNADGTKSAGISLSSNMSNITYSTLNFGNASGSWSHGLSAIPRASSVIVGVGTIGSPIGITINRQSPSFKHTIRYAWGNKRGTIANNVDTSASWNIPLDFANDIPSTTSGIGTIYVDTYSGSTKMGTQQVSFVATLPDNIKPTFSGVTLTDTNTTAKSILTGNNFLQIISDIQVNFSGAAGAYGSTITGYKAEIVDRNQSTISNGGRLGMMNFNGNATIRASVLDSRGRWSDSKDISITVLEYFAPILSFTAQRTRQSPNIIQINRNARVAPITLSGSQKNVMTLSFKVAPLGSTAFTPDNGSASGSWTTQNTLSNSPANMAGNYPANSSFTVIGTLADKFTSVEFSVTVATESVVFSYDKDNRFAVGKIVDTRLPSGSMDATGGYYLNGKPIQNHPLTASDGRSPYNASRTVDLNTKTINEFFSCNEPLNAPLDGQFYVAVYSESDNNLCQNLIQKGTGRMFTRTRHGGTWSAWIEYARVDHPNLINTGWQPAGFPGTFYKRVGDILTIKYDFTGNGDTMSIGDIPASVWVAPQSYMLIIAKWSIYGSDNSHVQINQGTGGLNALATGNGVIYRGQLTIMI